MYDKLVTKAYAIDTKILSKSGLLTKTRYYLDKQDLDDKIGVVEKKIPNISGLFKRTDYNAKLQKLKTRYLLFLV